MKPGEVGGLVVGVLLAVVLTVALSGVAGAGIAVLAAPAAIVFGGLGWLIGWFITKGTPGPG